MRKMYAVLVTAAVVFLCIIPGSFSLTGEEPALSVSGLPNFVKKMDDEGMAGVFYARINGRVVIRKAFGSASKELKVPNRPDTVFGTGSRPIDYTIAAILLLEQNGKLRLNEPVSAYLPDVPPDKLKITLNHLMTGGSGLPDFFDTDDDWDPDLAWVDRGTAVKRILAQKLLFPPGTKREHSHGAFGLLAAVVESVSGKPYYDFIREKFLDPAGMKRTGEYGEARGLKITDFAAGAGPQKIGIPNIPPNWGPTSWLIKGSGGMYSTLDDLLAFYRFLRSGKVLDQDHIKHFRNPAFNVDGSDRGFELFSAFMPPDTEVYLFLNEPGDRERLRSRIHMLVQWVRSLK